MRNAPRSIYLSFYAISSIVARAVKRAPHLPLQSDIDKRAIAEHLSKEALGGYVVFIILLVVLSGITAGLTLGLMSLDETQCKRYSPQSGSQTVSYPDSIRPSPIWLPKTEETCCKDHSDQEEWTSSARLPPPAECRLE